MPELGTSGSVRGRDGQPPGLLDRVFFREAYCREEFPRQMDNRVLTLMAEYAMSIA